MENIYNISKNSRGKFIPTLEQIQLIAELYNQGKSQRIIKDMFNISEEALRRIMKENNITTRKNNTIRNRNINNDIFSTIDTVEKAYWLGFLFSDGSICYNPSESRYQFMISLHAQDLQHLEKFRDFLQSNHTISVKENINNPFNKNKTTSKCSITIRNKVITTDLVNKGCIPNKSAFNIPFPDDCLPTLLLKKAFILGYYDGDGGFNYNVCKIDGYLRAKIYFTGSQALLARIQEILNSSNTIKLEHKCSHTFNLTISSMNKITTILDELYSLSSIFLKRKYDKYLEFKKIQAPAIGNNS